MYPYMVIPYSDLSNVEVPAFQSGAREPAVAETLKLLLVLVGFQPARLHDSVVGRRDDDKAALLVHSFDGSRTGSLFLCAFLDGGLLH